VINFKGFKFADLIINHVFSSPAGAAGDEAFYGGVVFVIAAMRASWLVA
jgi:hypothetical protein